jgi:hypothetical protein
MGYSYFEDTKDEAQEKVLLNEMTKEGIRTIVCGLDLKQVLMTQDTKQKT